ncbi:MAG TPA: glycoside hydrolase family 78 protein [Tepidisphaeraceae bacterium]|nr:glycoside hydrolase family 78 protein [Tepidisphaeraceae bacterium]
MNRASRLALIFIICLSVTLPTLAVSRPVNLQCQWLTNPLGIDTPKPALSWQMNSSVRGAHQTAYRILVGSSSSALEQDDGDVWDSGKIESDKSVEISYAGRPLVSGQRVCWKVRLWDKDGEPTRWSKPAQWSMGLLQPPDWTGHWIGKDEKSVAKDRHLPARWLRKEFSTNKKIRRATVHFAGLGWSELYINGQKIGDAVLSPALSDYTKRVYYLTYDATDALRRGPNVLGVILGNGRFFAPRDTDPSDTVNYGFPKLLLQLHIQYANGSTENIVSDGTWKLTTAGPIRANNEYDGEDYDARMELAGWDKPGFDDSHWQPAQLVAAPAGKLVAQIMDPIRIIGTVEPIASHQLKPGVFIYDMGQNMAGWVRLKVHGPAGATVTLRFSERLHPDGTLNIDNLRSAKATDHYTLSGKGTETWQPRFSYHGFRYIEMTGYPGTPTLDTLRGEVVADDLQSAGTFVCSNQLINKIYHNMFWGIRSNYHSIPSDCPQRDERQGWLGDRSEECRGESYLFLNRNIYSKWVTDIADSQNAKGGLSNVCPAYWPLYSDNVTWPSTFIIVPGVLLDQYGDTRTLAAHYPQMVRWIDHMAGYIKDDILPRDNYGDWCVPPADPKVIHSTDPKQQTAGAILSTTYFYHCLKLMSRYAALLHHPEDVSRFDALAARLKIGLNKKFLNLKLGQYDNGSQTSCVLPLAFNMVPPDEHHVIFDHLIQQITQVSHMHIGVGLVGGQWLNRVLSENDRPDIAYNLFTNQTYPSYGYMLDHGATTIWELWNGNTADPRMNSGNHVMLIGDSLIWLYQDLAGIRPDPAHPGFKHIILHLTPVGDLTFVKATHLSPYGMIVSDWSRNNHQFLWKVTIPPNTTATLFLPTNSPQSIRESGHRLSDADGVKVVKSDADRIELDLLPGTYHFRSQF